MSAKSATRILALSSSVRLDSTPRLAPEASPELTRFFVRLSDAKKSGVKESVFKALEPVSQNDRAKGGTGGHRFLSFTKSESWFRVHKEFFM